MSYWKRVIEARRSAKRKGAVKRSDGWVSPCGKWVVRMTIGEAEEVLVVRHRWSGMVAATLRLPVGTVINSTFGWMEGVIMGLVRKAELGQKGATLGPVKPAMMEREMPLVTSYLFDDAYENGEARQRSTITVMAGDLVGVKVVLNDRAEAMSLWVTGESVDDALLTMEILLSKPDAPWRRDKVYAGPKKK